MRLELFFKSNLELNTLLESLSQCRLKLSSNFRTRDDPSCSELLMDDFSTLCTAFNLANKVKNDNIIGNAEIIRKKFPTAKICAHYSIKYNSRRTVDDSFQYFNGFISKSKVQYNFFRQILILLSKRIGYQSIGIDEILVVSGGGEKKPFNTVSCLQMLARDSVSKETLHPLKLGVAFNPYIPEISASNFEISRLEEKLSTNLVSSINLQFGSDVTLLRTRLEGIVKLLDKLSGTDANFRKPKIVGSIFLPSKQLLARMRFRPWNGVFLSEAFLSSVEEAERIVSEIVLLYKEFDVSPLVETAVRNDAEVEHMLDLLMGRSKRTKVEPLSDEIVAVEEVKEIKSTKRRRTKNANNDHK